MKMYLSSQTSKPIFFEDQIKTILTNIRIGIFYKETIFTSISSTGKIITRVEKIDKKETLSKFLKYLKEHSSDRNR